MSAALRLAPIALFSCSLLALTGCPDDDDDTGTPDNGPADIGAKDADPDATPLDSGEPDSGDEQPDATEQEDAAPADGGGTAVTSGALTPGVGVTVDGDAIAIGIDTFDTVNTKLAAATRTATPDARSYEYAFSNTMLTIWYANTGLDANPANMVQGADLVLWIAVSEGFPGTTPAGVGLDSTRGDVEGAYGAAPHTVEIANPMGTLAQYYTTGLLVAYEPNDDVRTITISRAYPTEPTGTIDPMNASVTFGGGELSGSIDLGNLGTTRQNVTALLGEPDAEGTIDFGGNNLDTLSYGFIGIEVFFLEGGNRTLFFTVHPPFYGTTANGLGTGSTRADMETYLTGLGYAGSASSNPQLICYAAADPPMVGVSYTMTDNLVSSITLALPQCP